MFKSLVRKIRFSKRTPQETKKPPDEKSENRQQTLYERWTRSLSRFKRVGKRPPKPVSQPVCELCGSSIDSSRPLSACEFCDRILCEACVRQGVPQGHLNTCDECIRFFDIKTSESDSARAPADSGEPLVCHLCGLPLGEARLRTYCDFCNRVVCNDCVSQDMPERHLTTCNACRDGFIDIHPPAPGTMARGACPLCGRPREGERYNDRCDFCGEVLCSDCVLEDTPGEKAKACNACVAEERLRAPRVCEICGRPFEGRKYAPGAKRRRQECHSCNRFVCNECIEGEFSGTCTMCREAPEKPVITSTGVECLVPGACYYCGSPFEGERYKATCSSCYRPVCNACVVRDTPGYGWNTCKDCITRRRLRMKVSQVKAGGRNTCEICLLPFTGHRRRESCDFCGRALCSGCVEKGFPKRGLNTCRDCLKRYTPPALTHFADTEIAPRTHPPIPNRCSICEKPFGESWGATSCYYCKRAVCRECAYESTPALPYHTCRDCIGKIRDVHTSKKQCDICGGSLSDDPRNRFTCAACSRVLCEDCVHHHVPERYMNTCKECVKKIAKSERTICELCGMNLTADFSGNKGLTCGVCGRIICSNCSHDNPEDPLQKRCEACMKHLDVTCESCGKAMNFNERISCDYCNRILCEECIHFDVPDHHCRTCNECLKSW